MGESPKWDLNDLSVLFPLPDSLDSINLLSPKQGLLPERMYKTLPKLADFEDQNKLYAALRVVALRIDPERSEIRMVFQPLETGFMPGDEAVKTKDMAVHVFFHLTPIEFNKFLSGYQSLKIKYSIHSDSTLGVNTHMLSAYGEEFKSLVLKTTGEKKISKVTFMRLASIAGVWEFGGFDVKDGVMSRFIIPRARKALQTFTNIGRGKFISGKIEPALRGKDTFNNVIESLIKDASQSETLIAEVKAAYNVENPALYTVDTMDCVSCHTAQLVRHWSFSNFPEILGKEKWPETVSTDGLMLNNIRAFGYHERTPAINQRTVNETKEIVNSLNENLSLLR